MKSTVREKLETYYQQRAKRLESLTLDDILSDVAGVFWSPRSASAPEVVARLIERHLVSFEARWQGEIQDTDFCLAAIRSRNQVDERFDYEMELADAHNRLTLAFINKFCKPDYSIDWSKPLRFSRGRD